MKIFEQQRKRLMEQMTEGFAVLWGIARHTKRRCPFSFSPE